MGGRRRVRGRLTSLNLRLEIITDENLGTRLASEIRSRGRAAQSLGQVDLKGRLDPEVIVALGSRPKPCVLLTADDQMPWEHGEVIAAIGLTVATIDPDYPADYTEHQWRHDVAHRWIHAVAEQSIGSIRRYSIAAHRAWVPRKPRRR